MTTTLPGVEHIDAYSKRQFLGPQACLAVSRPGQPRKPASGRVRLVLLVVVAGPGLQQAALTLDVGLQVGDPDQLDRLDRQVAGVQGQRVIIQLGPGDPVAAFPQPLEADRPAIHRDRDLGPGWVGPTPGGGELVNVLGRVVSPRRGRQPQVLGQLAPALHPHGHPQLGFHTLGPDLHPQLRPRLGQRAAMGRG